MSWEFRRRRLLGLEIDTPVANAAGKVVQTLTGGVSAEAKASVEVLLDSIRGSKMWPTFTKMLQESGVRRCRRFLLSLILLLWLLLLLTLLVLLFLLVLLMFRVFFVAVGGNADAALFFW